jgi:FlaA1/EpsC-like NDP-sugar epimerase
MPRRAQILAGRAISFVMRHRRPLIVAVHLVFVGVSNYLAFWIRFDGVLSDRELALFASTLPWLIVIRMLAFIPFRLYEGLWRYTSIWDLLHIVSGVFVSSTAVFALMRWAAGLPYPASIPIIDSILLIFILTGLRLTRRIYRELRHANREKRVLIYGAGDAGEMLVRDMRHNPFYEYEPIGFVDDDVTKVGQRIHGVKVLGTGHEVARIIAEHAPDAVLVAMPRATPATIRSIVRALEPCKVPIQTLPSLRDVLGGKVTVDQIRTLSMEDLLERAPVTLDIAPVKRILEGKRVLVTGAGGSIGSELSRQIFAMAPATLVLLDRYENGLHSVVMELAAAKSACRIDAVIADVTDAHRLHGVLAAHRPQVVFHAAAHKHVPLMELNPCEAVKNNVRGTRLTADAARRSGVERFILISTDKAVNPTSVMGATKRIAEMLIQSVDRQSQNVFAAVRFGNVLASQGSVVPQFLEQIKAGGPVTITHPEICRYFMSIPEAVHLVLQAASLATGGDIFVLDMGQPIKILDLARNLIRLSGFVPDEEIRIELIGLRPGEKLYEELVGDDETAKPSAADRILRVEPKAVPDTQWLNQEVAELERLADAADVVGVGKRLAEIVPMYAPGRDRL